MRTGNLDTPLNVFRNVSRLSISNCRWFERSIDTQLTQSTRRHGCAAQYRRRLLPHNETWIPQFYRQRIFQSRYRHLSVLRCTTTAYYDQQNARLFVAHGKARAGAHSTFTAETRDRDTTCKRCIKRSGDFREGTLVSLPPFGGNNLSEFHCGVNF